MQRVLVTVLLALSGAAIAQGKIESGAIMTMDRASYPKAHKAWGNAGLKKVNDLLPQGAQLVIRSRDCSSLEMIGLSDERSDPVSKRVVLFADCQDKSKASVRYYVTEADIQRSSTPVSDKAAASSLSDSVMTRSCYDAAKASMKFPSSFSPTFGGTAVSRSPAKPGNVEVLIDFEAKNSLGAQLPHRAVCSFQAGKFVEVKIQNR